MRGECVCVCVRVCRPSLYSSCVVCRSEKNDPKLPVRRGDGPFSLEKRRFWAGSGPAQGDRMPDYCGDAIKRLRVNTSRPHGRHPAPGPCFRPDLGRRSSANGPKIGLRA